MAKRIDQVDGMYPHDDIALDDAEDMVRRGATIRDTDGRVLHLGRLSHWRSLGYECLPQCDSSGLDGRCQGHWSRKQEEE